MADSVASASKKDESGYTKTKIGTAEGAKRNDIEPATCIDLDLSPGEEVVKEYDVHIPAKMIPGWVMCVMCILTFGIFPCCYYLNRWCISIGCRAAGKIEFTRGKMAITNKGGLLIWKTEFEQEKGKANCCLKCLCLCGMFCEKNTFNPSVDYDSITMTRQYLVKDICQVMYDTSRQSGFCVPKCLQMCCCTERYDGRLRVYFGHFDFSIPDNFMGIWAVSTKWYESYIKTTFMESFAESFIASAFALFDSDMDFVEIVSMKEDESLLDLEHQKSDEVYAGLAAVHNELSNIISDYRKPIWNMPPKEEAAGLVQPEEKPQMDWGDMHAITETSMSLPTNYCPKADNEDLIGCLPNMYIMTCMDYIKTFLTVGLYYCFVVHKKQQYRSGFMLTTNRLVEITVASSADCIKETFSCFFPIKKNMKVVSYYPNQVTSGTIARRGFTLEVKLSTDCGALAFNIEKVPKADIDILMGASESRLAAALTFCKALMYSTSRPEGLINVENKYRGELSNIERNLLPLYPTERVAARYFGRVYDPYSCWSAKCVNMYHGIFDCLNCGIKPTFNDGMILLTDSSMFTIHQHTNKPWDLLCCFQGMYKIHDFDVFWTSVDKFQGAEVKTTLKGHETPYSRMFYKTWLGDNCCPQFYSQACLTCMVKGDGETVIGTKVNVTSFTDCVRDTDQVKAFRSDVASVRVGKMLSEAPTQAAAFATVVSVGAPKAPPPPPAPVYVQPSVQQQPVYADVEIADGMC